MNEQAVSLQDIKTCIKCGEAKPVTQFVFEKRTGHYQNVCLDCEKKRNREYYERVKAGNANKVIKVDPTKTKVCIRCRVEKPLTYFSVDRARGKIINTCKVCKALITRANYNANKEGKLLYAKDYRRANIDRINAYQADYREAHAEERRAYSRQYGREHKEEIKIKSKAYREAHKSELKKRGKQYAETHKEQIARRYKIWAKEHAKQLAEYNKQYRTANAEAISKQRQAYAKKNRKKITKYYLEKRTADPLFKLSTQVRGLIRISLKKKGYSKDTHTYSILGCDYETLWEHLKRTWLDNYGTEWNGEDYHIDHIIPLATAKTEQEVKDLCYYKNLQLLKPRDNLIKNKRLGWKLTEGNGDD